MNKTDEQQKRNFAMMCFIVLVITAAIVVWLIGREVRTTTVQTQTKQEEFYAPYWINDSTMHMNISESSCLLFQIEGNTCYVITNNIEYGVIDGDTIKMMYHDNNEFIYKEIYLDSIENLRYNDIYIE